MPEIYVTEVSATESCAAQEIPTSTLKVLNIYLEKTENGAEGKKEWDRKGGGQREWPEHGKDHEAI